MNQRREDLNQLVKRHIQSVVSNSPARAVATLESETSELIGSGMDTLNGKLADVEEDKLVGRVVELWGFFWDQVLPYVEGVGLLSFYLLFRSLTMCVGATPPPDRFGPILLVSYAQDSSKFLSDKTKWERFIIHALIPALVISPY
jgi:hypothetical protein